MQNRSLAWDTITMQIRSASISYATYKAKKTREYEKQLKMELDKLEKKMSTMPNERNQSKLTIKKQEDNK